MRTCGPESPKAPCSVWQPCKPEAGVSLACRWPLDLAVEQGHQRLKVVGVRRSELARAGRTVEESEGDSAASQPSRGRRAEMKGNQRRNGVRLAGARKATKEAPKVQNQSDQNQRVPPQFVSEKDIISCQQLYYGAYIGNETRTIEFKKGAGRYIKDMFHKDVCKYGCAFLNSGGGSLLIGVCNNGMAPLAFTEPTLFQIDQGKVYIRRDGSVHGPLRSSVILEWCRQMWIGKVQKLEECLREATSEKWFLAGQVQSLVQSINPMQQVIANLLLQRNATHADLQSSSGQSSPASSSHPLSSYGSSPNQSLHPHVESPP
ncbi:hypothetical protein L3Q82_002989 [Scortum barcoo]|uniref:Uncharacterized protein n=1 Tax=Scortum barcoo TaxID=214431 RepID=A0ACB8VS90_9TELE|nr:hypothetical protein L3Q82_002989 [Scortum barcoo]